jgi:hypothetical protein
LKAPTGLSIAKEKLRLRTGGIIQENNNEDKLKEQIISKFAHYLKKRN